MSIFSQIIEGKLPAHKIYEDRFCIAILDLYPLTKGHTLLIPKEKAVTLDHLSEAASAELGRILPSLCRAILKSTGAQNYHVLQNNGALAHQAIAQVHFHIIPKYESRQGLNFSWNSASLEESEAIQISHGIREALKDMPNRT
jgi:histidine triad (HIT) family protein